MEAEVAQHRFSLEEYEAMHEREIFKPDDRVELIRGVIVELSPTGARHAACVNRLTRLFTSALPESAATVSVQNSIEIRPHSIPEPDAALLAPRSDFYEKRRPFQQDVLLVVEVAESSLKYDRSLKMPLYAEAGIGEAWIVDLTAEAVEVYRRPVAGRYTELKTYGKGESIAPLAFTGIAFPVDRML